MFRLLDLPDELWSRICKLAIPHRRVYFDGYEASINAMRLPAITRTCRVIREELLEDFYEHQLEIVLPCWVDNEHHPRFRDWLYTIGRRYRRILKGVKWVSIGPASGAKVHANVCETVSSSSLESLTLVSFADAKMCSS